MTSHHSNIIKALGAVFFCASFGQLYSQNMVVNSTYEGKCIHHGFAQIDKANGWSNANGGTVDLFDKEKAKCKNSPNAMPQNYMGYQQSGDGQNYAGLTAFYDDDAAFDSTSSLPLLAGGYKRYTEYLQGELREALVAGNVYQVSFRLSLAEKSGRAVSCMGALLTSQKIEQKSNTFLNKTPQFISHRVISDSVNWIVLSGAYVATGGEKFITIGCFRDADFQVEKVVPENKNDSRKAYYYVSEVNVAPYGSMKPNLDAIVLGVDYVELMNVLFDTGRSEVKPSFSPELDEVATWMVTYPDYKFFIAGYTDQQGGDAINDPLSRERARNVKKYLVSKGAKESNILTEGFGSENPVEYKYKSHLNRRVEIYLYNTNVTKL